MKLDFFLSFAVLLQVVVTSVQSLLPLLGFISVEQAAALRVVVTVATYAPAIYAIMRRNMLKLVVAFSLYSLIALVSYVLFPHTHKFLESNEAIVFTPIVILTALAIASIRNIEMFRITLLWISRVCVVVSVMYYLAFTLSPFKEDDEAYSMSFGYSMLLPMLFLVMQTHFYDKIASFVILVVVVLIGSRGPVAVAGLYYVAYFLLFNRNSKHSFRILLLMVVLGVATISILPKYVDVDSSRTLKLITTGEVVSHDSGRGDLLYNDAERIIMDSPVVGWGIGSDRDLLGFYVHNIFLEMMIHYGILFGPLIILMLIVSFLRIYRNKQMIEPYGGRPFFLITFLYGFVPLIVSNSYLQDTKFAFFLGFLLLLSRRAKNKRVAVV